MEAAAESDLNYGLRGDDLNSYRNEKQLVPRINLVWLPIPGHDPARRLRPLLQPAALRAGGHRDGVQFQNTTGASAADPGHHPVRRAAELLRRGRRSRRLLDRRLTLGVDVFYRKSHNLIDEGQFGAPIILTPFNYANGLIFGQEFTANYVHGPLAAYANFTYRGPRGRTSLQPVHLRSRRPGLHRSNYIYLDHDQTYTASAGASYLIRDGLIGGTAAGLRRPLRLGCAATGLPTAPRPQRGARADYLTVNLTAAHHFTCPTPATSTCAST